MTLTLPPSLPKPIADRILASKLPAIHLTPTIATKPLPLTSTKLAGTPYWPKAADYPTDPDGKPLMMVAQLNFAELPTLERYPTYGILQFFISPHDGAYGLNFDAGWEQSAFRIVYHPTVETDSDALAHIHLALTPELMVPVTREHSLTAESVLELVSAGDYRFTDIVVEELGPEGLPDELDDQIHETLSGDGTKIGGYPTFTQGDPRGYSKSRDADGRQPEGEWRLLFQMDTYGDDIMWGDSGVANWFIREADLAHLDFSHVWYNWDCF